MTNSLYWEIENPQVKKMDDERVGINTMTASFERQVMGDPYPYASLSTGNDIAKHANGILRRSSGVDRDGLSSFDRAVFNDVVYHAQRAKTFHSYFVDSSSKLGIGKFLSDFYEPGTYTGFLNSARPENLPHDLFRDEELLRTKIFSKTPDAFTAYGGSSVWAKEQQMGLRDALEVSRADVEPFYKNMGIGAMKYNLQLAPSGGGFSYWIGNTFLAAIDPDRFSFSNGRYDSFLPSLILAHELGHAHHGKESENFPRGLIPNDSEYSLPFHSACCEGVALAIEEEFISYSKTHLDLSSDERKLLKLFWATYLPKKTFQIAHSLLERKESEEISNPNYPESLKITPHEKLSEISGIKHFSDYFSFDDYTILDTMQQIGYQVGNKNISNIVEKLRERRVPSNLIFRSIMQGVWVNPEAQRDFIFNSYLPRVLD